MILLWLEPLGGAFLALSARHSGPSPSWAPPTHSPAGSCSCPGAKESAARHTSLSQSLTTPTKDKPTPDPTPYNRLCCRLSVVTKQGCLTA